MCRSQAGWDTSLTGDAVGRDVVAMAFAAHGGHRFLSACIQSERLHDVAVVLELREDLEPRGGRGSSTGNRQDAEKDRVSARVSPQGPVCERHAGFWVRHGRSHAAFDLCRPDGGLLSLRARPLMSILLLLISISDCCPAFCFCSSAFRIAVQHFAFAHQHLRFAVQHFAFAH